MRELILLRSLSAQSLALGVTVGEGTEAFERWLGLIVAAFEVAGLAVVSRDPSFIDLLHHGLDEVVEFIHLRIEGIEIARLGHGIEAAGAEEPGEECDGGVTRRPSLAQLAYAGGKVH